MSGESERKKESKNDSNGSEGWLSWSWIILIVLILITLLIIYFFYFERAKSAYRKIQSLSKGEDSLQDTLLDSTSLDLPSTSEEKKSPAPVRWKREEACRKILEDIYQVKFEKCHPEFLRNPKTNHKLELDGYNHQLKIAFEHNGEQHYNYPNAFHKTREDFIYQLQKDRFKHRACLRHHVYLITIPYTVPWDRLRSYIISKLPREETSTESLPDLTEVSWTE